MISAFKGNFESILYNICLYKYKKKLCSKIVNVKYQTKDLTFGCGYVIYIKP